MRSYYATPIDLGYRPWSLDITPDDAGNAPFPHGYVVNPYLSTPTLQWTTGDWDPALRFWTLPFDPNLSEWLKSVDTAMPSILAAREFAAHHEIWHVAVEKLVDRNWLEPEDLQWQLKPDGSNANAAYSAIRVEIEQLQQLMEDDRDRYLAESEAQADGLSGYMMAFIGASQARHPWTVELLSCGLAIGNIAYMRWKSDFKRVRPSTLCPGLIPPFGPPGHPAFPSGHSTLGHLLALLLLEIPALRQRYGVFKQIDGRQAVKVDPKVLTTAGFGANPLAGRAPIESPLLWLSGRLAKNRERLGVHYASDSSAGRHLAAGLWRALLHESQPAFTIDCPTLKMVLARASAEWQTPWP